MKNTKDNKRNSTRWFSLLIAAGIFLSRIAGLIRDRIFAHYFGNSDAADAFRAAFKIPNFLQNLFGEGVLSASFIPVYSRLLAENRKEEAKQVAEAILSLLILTISILTVIGILAAPVLVDVIAPGFKDEKRELTIVLVKILFPGAGLLVLSAWCLGVLNSHNRFFLSYAAPVIWNTALIATMVAFGGTMMQYPLTECLAWGSVIGSGLQVIIQLPTVFSFIRGLRLTSNFLNKNARAVVHNFFPVFISRGVVQISSFVDALLASLLPTGAVSALSYGQTLYMLPVSLFGMSVSAAELPAMSKAVGNKDEIALQLRKRLNSGLQRIALFIVPTSMGFLALGDVIAAAIYQTGHFTHGDAVYVWSVLAGSTVGLLASTMGRLYSSAFYALQDTRTPLKFSIIRVLLTIVLGYIAAILVPPMIGINARWGVAGLTASAGIAGWVEFSLLRYNLGKRIGYTGISFSYSSKLWVSAALAAATALAVQQFTRSFYPVIQAILILIPYGGVYFVSAYLMKIPLNIIRRMK